MIYLLDTNILIYLLKNKPPAVAQRVNALAEDAVLGMSFVTYAELLKGAERSIRKLEVQRQLDKLLGVVPVHYEGSAYLCRHYAVQSNQLRTAEYPWRQ